METKARHEYAVYLFHQGFYADAVSLLDEALRTEESAERWSDWATSQYALGRFAEAERGFRRALDLDPGMPDAAVNFGVLLSSQGRYNEGAEFFEKALLKLEGDGRSAVETFILQCRAQLGAASSPESFNRPG